MKFQLDSGKGTYSIHGYSTGAVRVNQQELTRSFVIAPEHLIVDWAPEHINQLRSEHLQAISALKPEIVILGTGSRLHFPPPAVTASLTMQQIGVEVMDTAAACRIYMVLMSEGRNVAAGMILERAEIQ